MTRDLVADTSGLLRALAATPDGGAAFPDFERALRSARRVIVPLLILAEVDYFLRDDRRAMRTLVRDVLDPATSYELEPTLASDLVRAMVLDARYADLGIGLVDGMVAAVAERRNIRRILTADRRDFQAIRVGEKLATSLTIVP